LAAAASAPSKYTGMYQAIKDILREEGVPVKEPINKPLIFFCPFEFGIVCLLF